MALGGIISFLLLGVAIVWCDPKPPPRKFPEGFLLGTATAAYQIEGGWNADGKSPSIWDNLTHSRPEAILDRSNGDIAANSYYLYKRDVQMLRELGVDFYRFSISWTRILPTGFPDKINPAGVKYYNNLINELLKYNIQPMITLFHWDLPQNLQDLGGWTNPEIVTWFSDYSRIVFKLFGDRVKYFVTINEPINVCLISTRLPPVPKIAGTASYLCSKNLLVAHARAYQIYDEEFRAFQKGKIFITISAEWYEPASENDMEAVLDAIQFSWAIYAWPIFSETGDFPPEMKKRIAAKSLEQGFARSRLPEFTPEEVELIRGSSDFFGLNHYTTRYVYRNANVPVAAVPSVEDDLDVGFYQLPEWQIGKSNYTMYVPWGFKRLLDYIRENYRNPPVFITENGFSTTGGLVDDDRVKFYRGYLGALLDAIDDGCDVRGFAAWSLMDNFEWIFGYTERFGLYEVDFTSVDRARSPRTSAYVYKEILRTRKLDQHYRPNMTKHITIDKGH